MSAFKKTTLPLILLFLFAVIAGGSWYYFSNKGASDGGAEVSESGLTDANSTLMDAHTASDAPHGHDHGNTASNGATIGQKGTVQTFDVNPLLGVRGVGDPAAPVTVREFFSLTCNHCADFHTGVYQELKAKYIDTGKIYFIYEEFPLNGPALYGSMIARCLPEERYTGFVDLLLRTQDKWAFSGDFKSALLQNAKLAGMSDAEFETCFNNKELQKAIATNIKQVSDAWEISSTPSFVVNDGERILRGGQTFENFEKLYTELTGQSADAAPAPDANVGADQREVWSEMQNNASDSVDDAIIDTGDFVDGVEDMGDDVMNAVDDVVDDVVIPAP